MQVLFGSFCIKLSLSNYVLYAIFGDFEILNIVIRLLIKFSYKKLLCDSN